MGRTRLLVVDRQPDAVADVEQVFGDRKAEVTALSSPAEAVSLVARAGASGETFDVVLVDYFLPDHGGVAVMEEVTRSGIDSRVIVMSERDLGNVAVEAMRLGAFDFIAKPLNGAELKLRVERALRDRETAGVEVETVRSRARRPRKSDVIIGHSQWVKDVFERISMVAPTDVTVAITGESGTGKELVARTIHNLSHRYQRPFVVVNCAAIPEHLLEDELFGHVRGAFTDATTDRKGLLASAESGTLFLDEIGEMSLSLQSKLLRVIQSQEFRRVGEDTDVKVDVRFITATHCDLEQAVADGTFREDLYYRINVFPLSLVPLRERREDIPLLAHHFLLKNRDKVGKRIEGFTPEAIGRLCAHDYPGNVRELENRVHHALVLAQGTQIDAQDLEFEQGTSVSAPPLDLDKPFRDLKKQIVEDFESRYVHDVIVANNGNVAAAARQAGMDRKNLWALAKKYSLDLNALRRKR